MNKSLIFLTLIVLLGCHPDKNKHVDLNKLKFETTDASELYFKNVRKSEYRLEENKQAGIETYHHPDFEKARLALEPFIILNWRTDQAYLFFETRASEPVEFLIGKQRFTFDPSFQRNHAELALHIYNAILSNYQVMILDNNKNQKQFFESADQKTIYRKVIFDFLRLVELR